MYACLCVCCFVSSFWVHFSSWGKSFNSLWGSVSGKYFNSLWGSVSGKYSKILYGENDFFFGLTTERLLGHKIADWQLFPVSPEDSIVIFWHWLQLRKSLLSESFKSLLIFFDVLQVHYSGDIWIYFYIFSLRLCTSTLRTYVFFRF